ncbi:MAG: hypothetical protein GC162_14730 [Planctomycetes bacterium]|nr:hypothetical protein [Planctomycetota bacterium]
MRSRREMTKLCLWMTLACVLGAFAPARAATVLFFDDFEDDTTNGADPVLTYTSLGGDDLADVGVGWSSLLGGTTKGVAGGTDRYLDLGAAVADGDVTRYIDAQFTSTARLGNQFVVSFGITFDRTPSGSRDVFMDVMGGSTSLLQIDFRHGPNKRIIYNGVDRIDVADDDMEIFVTLTLNPTSFDLAVTGYTSATGLAYQNSLANINALRFTDAAQSASRLAQVDDVKVTVAAVPTPAALPVGAVLLSMLMTRRRRA